MSTPTTATVERIAETCDMIRADIKADVERSEGAAFTGANVATMYGNLAACVDAIAGMVKVLAESIDGRIDAAVENHCENRPHIYADGSTA